MMKSINMLIALMLLLNVSAFAGSDVEMADAMRADGKIYVVVAVLAIVFIGIVFYLVWLDSRISKLEKK